MSKKPNIKVAATDFICTSDARSCRVAFDPLMHIMATKLSLAIKQATGQNIRVSYHNVLERDTNPDGTQVFFCVIDETSPVRNV